MLEASLPISGSVSAKAARVLPVARDWSQRCFCSGVPHWATAWSVMLWTVSMLSSEALAAPVCSHNRPKLRASQPRPPWSVPMKVPSSPWSAMRVRIARGISPCSSQAVACGTACACMKRTAVSRFCRCSVVSMPTCRLIRGYDQALPSLRVTRSWIRVRVRKFTRSRSAPSNLKAYRFSRKRTSCMAIRELTSPISKMSSSLLNSVSSMYGSRNPRTS